MEFIMGGIIQFGGNFSPKDWASCDGQLVAISQNQALFAILGNTFGGDGRTNFSLPDLRSRVPIGRGRGPGLTEASLGRPTGHETNELQVAQMPTHNHTASFTGTGESTGGFTVKTISKMIVAKEEGDTNDPSDAYLAMGLDGRNGINIYKESPTTTSELNLAAITSTTTVSGSSGGITGGSVDIGTTGGGAAFSIIQPSLGMNFIIAIEGVFPSRN